MSSSAEALPVDVRDWGEGLQNARCCGEAESFSRYSMFDK